MSRISETKQSLRVLADAGVLTTRVDQLVLRARALRRFGPTPTAGFAGVAANFPDRPYVIDEQGMLTYADVDRRTDQIARALRAAGIGERDGVGVLCRNGRAFVETTIACGKIGATVLFMNTDFAGPQLRDVLEREDAKGLISDAEFDRLLPEGVYEGARWIGFADDQPTTTPTLASVIGPHLESTPPPPPQGIGRLVILTSGTTGLPKGAARDGAPISAVIGILDRVPLRSGQRQHIVAPMFHGWGLLNFSLGLVLGTTLVLRRRFDPEETLRVIAEHGVHSAPMVPTMLQRILQLPEDVRAGYDTSTLETIPLSGSTLPGDLALRAIEAFGPVPYNFYGSTETGWATIATPDDLAQAPGTAGRPPLGTGLLLLDDDRNEVPRGVTGRIFVASKLRMAGYTDPQLAKAEHAGHMSTGDVGHLDPAGRLFIDGRDDDMIVSGGENVFPREVEDLLAAHPEVVEAAVIGVPDEDFGQALRAFVVLKHGSSLSADDLRGYTRENLARYKVPRTMVLLDELPRNPTGKVLKRVLLERFPVSGAAGTAKASK